MFPPVLSLGGWTSAGNSVTGKDLRVLMLEFMSSSLRPDVRSAGRQPLAAPMHLASLYRYPVKGLTPEPLQRASLAAGETLAFDRAWAIENGPGRFDPAAPRHLPKINFLMLMRDERLATLRTQFDDATETLTILRDGKQVARGQLTTPLGRQLIEQFIGAYMKAELRGPPEDRARPRAQLLRRRGQVRAHRQPRQRARAGAHARTAGRPAALSRQPVPGGGRALGRVRLDGQGDRGRRRQALRLRAHDGVARRPTSTRRVASATWPSPPTCSAPGAIRTSASTPRW